MPCGATPARANRSHANASRIWDGSLYIDFRFSRAIPNTSSSSSPGSTSIFQDRFGARSVRFPEFINENVAVVNNSLGPRIRNMSRIGRVGPPYASLARPDEVTAPPIAHPPSGQSVIETTYIGSSKKASALLADS